MTEDQQLPDPDGQGVETQVGDAIANIIAQVEGGFVMKWVALIETAGPDGDRGLWTLTGDNVKSWDTAGLLTHALHLQQAQVAAALMRDDDDDD